MITGYVHASEASVPIVLVGPDRELQIPAVIDTGFNGELVVPPDLMSEFGQGRIGYLQSRLADGSFVEHQSMYVDFYYQSDPSRRYRTRALGIGHEPLIGMGLLEGFHLAVDVVEGGNVAIDPLSRQS